MKKIFVDLARTLSDPCNSAAELISNWDGRPPVSGRPSGGAEYRPKRTQNRLDPDLIAELVATYQVGATVRDLAQSFGIHRATVSEHLRRAGVRTRYRKFGNPQIKEAAELYAQGWSLARLGERFGICDSTVLNAFRRNGFKTRPQPGKRRDGS